MSKVFGIGLNKTGTRSVAHAVRLLGYRTLHKGDDATSQLVEDAFRSNEPLLTRIGEQFDAYFDVDAIVRRFAELDRQYSGSKFILTTRDVDGWIASRQRHVEANRERAARGDYAGTFLTVDTDTWLRDWRRHHEAVADHFADRNDLLIFNVVGGEGWEKLAPFLDRAVPSSAFPWENREGAGTYRSEGRVRSLRRRASYIRRRVSRAARW